MSLNGATLDGNVAQLEEHGANVVALTIPATQEFLSFELSFRGETKPPKSRPYESGKAISVMQKY